MSRPDVLAESSASGSILPAVESKVVEWPAGSGVVAEYSPAERALVRDLFRARDEERISDAQLRQEVGVLHDLKALLGARLVEAPTDGPAEAEQTALYLPEPDSPFQIPGRALRGLVGAET